jgi:hypothetical protein
MKKILGIMVFMTFMVAGFGGGMVAVLLSKVNGGGVAETFIYPLYGGQILLSGIVVACACIIYDELKSIKKDIEEMKKS